MQINALNPVFRLKVREVGGGVHYKSPVEPMSFTDMQSHPHLNLFYNDLV